jgi:hypothetical protein
VRASHSFFASERGAQHDTRSRHDALAIHTLVTIAPLDRHWRGRKRAGGTMMGLWRGAGTLIVAAVVWSAAATGQTTVPPRAPVPPGMVPPAAPAPAARTPVADQPASNPVCVQLESQLALIDRGLADPARAGLIKHGEDTIAKQQAELDRTLARSRRLGCEGIGFFTLFTGRAPQCQPLTTQIQEMRDNLDRMMSDLERLKSGNGYDRAEQRRALVSQLAQNNCGPQYRAAAAAAGPAGFLDSLFGGTVINPGGDGAPAGTYRTLCVRTCDGYYFPISYSTVPTRFADDQRACQRECPAAEVMLYTYRNPGEDIPQAVSLTGQPYTALPTAFLYRKQFNPACSCRRPGQSWADALKNADDATTLQRGDIVVNEQTAKTLSQAPQPKGKPLPKAAAASNNAAARPAPADAASQGTGAASNPAATAAATPVANASSTASPDTAPAAPAAGSGIRTVGPLFVAH